MAKSCCEAKTKDLVHLRDSHKTVLQWVLVINAMMFVIELTGGLIGHSSALTSDSLDMFGDALVYAFSLYALDRGQQWRAAAGLLKGGIMAALGTGAMAGVIYRLAFSISPSSETMGAIGVLALAANFCCLVLLYRHRRDDINMRSTWICSRNDIIANLSVLFAALFVYWTGRSYPDALVGLGIAALFLVSAFQVLVESLHEWRQASIPKSG